MLQWLLLCLCFLYLERFWQFLTEHFLMLFCLLVPFVLLCLFLRHFTLLYLCCFAHTIRLLTLFVRWLTLPKPYFLLLFFLLSYNSSKIDIRGLTNFFILIFFMVVSSFRFFLGPIFLPVLLSLFSKNLTFHLFKIAQFLINFFPSLIFFLFFPIHLFLYIFWNVKGITEKFVTIFATTSLVWRS